ESGDVVVVAEAHSRYEWSERLAVGRVPRRAEREAGAAVEAAPERDEIAAGAAARAGVGAHDLERGLVGFGPAVAGDPRRVAGRRGRRFGELHAGTAREDVGDLAEASHLTRHGVLQPARRVAERVDRDALHEVEVLAPGGVGRARALARHELEPRQRV